MSLALQRDTRIVPPSERTHAASNDYDDPHRHQQSAPALHHGRNVDQNGFTTDRFCIWPRTPRVTSRSGRHPAPVLLSLEEDRQLGILTALARWASGYSEGRSGPDHRFGLSAGRYWLRTAYQLCFY